MAEYKNPLPTVDIIITVIHEGLEKVVLIERKNPPFGWALPGGFVEYGESLEDAAVREAHEETGLKVELIRQFHSYSDPSRDARGHTISTVFLARAEGFPAAADDAKSAGLFSDSELPEKLTFDHGKILDDFINMKY